MRPQPSLVWCFCTSRDMRKAPRRCTFITESQSPVVILNSRLSRMMPALFTRMVGAPSSFATRSTAATTFSSSATSAPTPMALPPVALIPSATSRQAASSRSRTATA